MSFLSCAGVAFRTRSLSICLLVLVCSTIVTGLQAGFGEGFLPPRGRLTAFGSDYAVWITGDGSTLCFQTHPNREPWTINVSSLSVSSSVGDNEDAFRLPEDFFITTGSDGLPELTGTLSVHHSVNGSWIFLGSKNEFYYLEYSLEQDSDVKDIGLRPIYKPVYKAMQRTEMTGNIEFVYSVPFKVSMTSTGTPFDLILIIGNELVMYQYGFQSSAKMVFHENLTNLLGEYRQITGLTMTKMGLYISTEDKLHLFRLNSSGGIDLYSPHEFQSPHAFVSGSRRAQSSVGRINSLLAFAHEGGEEYLTLSTDAGCFIGRNGNQWHEFVIRNEQPSPIRYAVINNRERRDSYPYIYFVRDTRESRQALSNSLWQINLLPSYKPYRGSLYPTRQFSRSGKLFSWPATSLGAQDELPHHLSEDMSGDEIQHIPGGLAGEGSSSGHSLGIPFFYSTAGITEEGRSGEVSLAAASTFLQQQTLYVTASAPNMEASSRRLSCTRRVSDPVQVNSVRQLRGRDPYGQAMSDPGIGFTFPQLPNQTTWGYPLQSVVRQPSASGRK